jgi:hypothetical protein
LAAQITQADVAAAGTANVQVGTGNVRSAAVAFSINPIAALQFS